MNVIDLVYIINPNLGAGAGARAVKKRQKWRLKRK
jgi:hypothetical protein